MPTRSAIILNMSLVWQWMTIDSQMLLFSWERIGEVFLVFRLVFPNFRLQGSRDFLHEHVDLLHDVASLTDFIFLKMTERSTSSLCRPHSISDSRQYTFVVGILSFINSASRQRTSQGAWIFTKPTPGSLVWKTKIKTHGLSIRKARCCVLSIKITPWGKDGDISDHVRAYITGFLLHEENVSGVCTGKTCVVAYWPKLKSPPPSLYGILAPTYGPVDPKSI